MEFSVCDGKNEQVLIFLHCAETVALFRNYFLCVSFRVLLLAINTMYVLPNLIKCLGCVTPV